MPRETAENSINPITERAEQLVEVLWEVYTGVSRTGLARLPLLPTFPIVAILRQVVFSNDDENLHPVSTTVEHRSGFKANENVSMARRLCKAILDGMLEKEECDIEDCDPLPTAKNNIGERNNGFDHPISLELFAMHLVYMCSARQIHSSALWMKTL